MKNILFVIPNLKIGGTNSSLSVLYSELLKLGVFKISILSLASGKNSKWNFEHSLIKTGVFFTAYHENPNDAKGIYYLVVVLIKIFKRLCFALHIDIQSIVYNRKAKQIESTSKYDYIVAFEEGMPTKFVSFFHGHKIAWIHCNYSKYCPSNMSELNYYLKYERIICVAKYTLDVFLQKYPILRDKSDYIYNLINEDKINEGANKTINDKRFSIDKPVTLISAGRFDPVKRFSYIPEIASIIRKAGVRFNWYILGPESSAQELDVYNKNTRNYDVMDCVHWLGNKTNPYKFFKNCTLYVCTSESEACPMVFNEAMHLHIPVVSTNFGSASEFIENGYNGIICPLEELANKLIDLLQNKNKIDSLKSHINEVGSYNASIMVKIKELFK